MSHECYHCTTLLHECQLKYKEAILVNYAIVTFPWAVYYNLNSWMMCFDL